MRFPRIGLPVPPRLARLAVLLLLLFCIVQFTSLLPSVSDRLPSFGRLGAWPRPPSAGESEQESEEWTQRDGVDDEHPIRRLMREANIAFEKSEGGRSKTFPQAVEKYRRTYGRHPPPGFDKWYTFARQRHVYDIDDFQQINDDLRPFWGTPPDALRRYAAHAGDNKDDGVATISIRNGKAFEGDCCGWRSEMFLPVFANIATYLPDMDIPMNRMDQPRVVVPWDDVQAALKLEEGKRGLVHEGVVNKFTKRMAGLWRAKQSPWMQRLNGFLARTGVQREQNDTSPLYGWHGRADGTFMEVVSQACPPASYARNPDSADHLQQAELSYTDPNGGFVTNFNLSADLCTVGPQLSHLHGLLFAPTSMSVTQKLVPVFSECKTSVNNDILFPATMYYKEAAKNFEYHSELDEEWDAKDEIMFWRGSSSGGTARRNFPDQWRAMHRQRLVLETNSTEIAGKTTPILTISDDKILTYTPHDFSPAPFAANYTDIEFSKFIACVPDCSFYDKTFSTASWIPFHDGFKYKYLIDVDGHSFSGRWRAYLQSRSLALKATIIREWHDSRLRAWRHFVPMDNRYKDLYSLLTYFVGYTSEASADGKGVNVSRHDSEAYNIASQGRQRAAQVLRNDDMDIYVFRLLLEYGRLIDDNRDSIGYVGDGGKEMERVDQMYPAVD